MRTVALFVCALALPSPDGVMGTGAFAVDLPAMAGPGNVKGDDSNLDKLVFESKLFSESGVMNGLHERLHALHPEAMLEGMNIDNQPKATPKQKQELNMEVNTLGLATKHRQQQLIEQSHAVDNVVNSVSNFKIETEKLETTQRKQQGMYNNAADTVNELQISTNKELRNVDAQSKELAYLEVADTKVKEEVDIDEQELEEQKIALQATLDAVEAEAAKIKEQQKQFNDWSENTTKMCNGQVLTKVDLKDRVDRLKKNLHAAAGEVLHLIQQAEETLNGKRETTTTTSTENSDDIIDAMAKGGDSSFIEEKEKVISVDPVKTHDAHWRDATYGKLAAQWAKMTSYAEKHAEKDAGVLANVWGKVTGWFA